MNIYCTNEYIQYTRIYIDFINAYLDGERGSPQRPVGV